MKGFSLIELLVVMVVVGLLSAIAISGYKSYSVRAKVTEAINLMETYKNQVGIYYAKNGTLLTWEGTPVDTDNAIATTSNCCNNIYYWKTTLGNGDQFIQFWPDWKTSVFNDYNFTTNAYRVYIMTAINPTNTGVSTLNWVCGYDTRSAFAMPVGNIPASCTHTWDGTTFN